MKEARYGSWKVVFDSDDGARINSLMYEKTELLTTAPEAFHPSERDYGTYETRPVYGYDDCFPSVNVCTYPGTDWEVPDHGEICWLPWQVEEKSERLIFSVRSKNLPLGFRREMYFSEKELTWEFSVSNPGDKAQPFQHVMHPLMPLNAISDFELPEFDFVFDEIAQKSIDLPDGWAVRDFLLSQPSGTTNMLFLQNIHKGRMIWTYRSGLCVEALFSEKYFPSIGIWWNNSAYPDENGCRRNECAFEPIPGMNSTLADAYRSGHHLLVDAGRSFNWRIHWLVK
jgi:hypothetical protein